MARLLKAAAQVLLIAIASPVLADEAASGLYVPGNFGFGAGVTPDAGFYLSTGLAHYDGDIKIFIDGGKIVLNAEKRPYSLAFATLSHHYRTDGASLLNLMRSIGQSAGISMVTVLLARNIQTSHADLASHVTSQTIPAIDLSSIDRFGVLSDSVFGFADGMINQQAAMIAYIDDFYLMAWISIAVVPLVLLLKKPKGKVEAVIAE